MGSRRRDSRSRPQALHCTHSKEEPQRLSEFGSGRPYRQDPGTELILAAKCLLFPIDTGISLRGNRFNGSS